MSILDFSGINSPKRLGTALLSVMHFSKAFTQLLLTLPPELRDNAIEYRKVSCGITYHKLLADGPPECIVKEINS